LIFGTLTYNKIVNVIPDSIPDFPEQIIVNNEKVKKLDEEENLLHENQDKVSTELSSNSN